MIGAKGATFNDWKTTCGTLIDFTIPLRPSPVVRGLWGQVAVHESTAPGQPAGRRVDQYDLPPAAVCLLQQTADTSGHFGPAVAYYLGVLSTN